MRNIMKEIAMYWFFAAVVILVLTSCGTTTGNYMGSGRGLVNLSIQGTPPGSLDSTQALHTAANFSLASDMTLNAYVPSFHIKVKNYDGNRVGRITITQAWMAISQIKFKRAIEDLNTEEAEEDERVKFEGPFVVDLLNNETFPPLSSVVLAAGTYSDISLKIHKLNKNEFTYRNGSFPEAHKPLIDHSIIIGGLYTGNTDQGFVTNIPFSFSFNLTEHFYLTDADQSTEGFVVEESDDNPIVIAFRLSRWFSFKHKATNPSNIDVSKIHVENNQIVLNENGNNYSKIIRSIIKKNIQRSADFGRDRNKNGKLDISEDDDPDSDDDEDDEEDNEND